MAPVNPALHRNNSNISSPGNAAETSTPVGTTDRRGKRPAEEISSEGPSAVDLLLGGTLRTPPEERATVVQSRVAAAEGHVPGRHTCATQKKTTTADAGPPGPMTQKRQRAAPSADITPVNPPPPPFDYAAAAGAALVIAAARTINYSYID
ncbi:unnamed protein product [Closterium sp. NIES-53]